MATDSGPIYTSVLYCGGNIFFTLSLVGSWRIYIIMVIGAARLYPHSKVGMMAELNRHVTQMIVASDDTRFTGQGGGD